MIKKFNLNDFITTENWTMTAIFEIDGHWVEGKLYYDDGDFTLALYCLDYDSYDYCSDRIEEIANYILLD